MLPQDGYPKDAANNAKVDPESFADQVNYLAALGRLVVPRAFAFVGLKVLFIGHEPFDAEDLGGLLPDGAEWYEHQYAPEGFSPDIVVVGRLCPKGLVKGVMEGIGRSPKVVPQEGFVDELLFGHDWWDEKLDSLQEMAHPHRGLQSARSVGALRPVGMDAPQPTEKKASPARNIPASSTKLGSDNSVPGGANAASSFSWPSAEAEETRGGSEGDYDLRDRSRLKELGYDTNQPPSVRWRILTTKAVPELGLPKVAGLIAWLCRSRKAQRGGREKFARAIGEWEHDLNRLKREVYPKYRSQFAWPRSEP